MHLFRSLIVLAAFACLSGLAAPMAASAVPIDPGLQTTEKSYPAPALDVVAAAAVAVEVPAAPRTAGRLSQQAAIVVPVIVVPIVRPADLSCTRPHLRC